MIKNINSYDPDYISVSGNYSTYPFVNSSSECAGMLRWNSATSRMEVNDGVGWRPIPAGDSSIELGPKAKEIFAWAEEKMAQEQKLEEMMEQYPALRKAKENFDTVLNLVKDNSDAV